MALAARVVVVTPSICTRHRLKTRVIARSEMAKRHLDRKMKAFFKSLLPFC